MLGVPDLGALARLAGIERTLKLPPDPVRRLGALVVRTVEDAARLRERLRLSNDEDRRLRSIGEAWRIGPGFGEAEARVLLYRAGADDYRDRVLIALVRSGAGTSEMISDDLVALPERWTPPKFPLAAKDFIARGVEKGPALGKALEAAEEAWIAAGFPAAADRIASIVETAITVARAG